jgi:hypothetical protein
MHFTTTGGWGTSAVVRVAIIRDAGSHFRFDFGLNIKICFLILIHVFDRVQLDRLLGLRIGHCGQPSKVDTRYDIGYNGMCNVRKALSLHCIVVNTMCKFASLR